YGMAHEHPHVSIPRRTTARTARTPRVRATARIWVPAPISRTPSADAGGLRTPATPTAHRTSPSQRRSAARPRAGTRAAIGGTRATPRRPGTGPSHGLRRARDHLDGHLDALGGEVDELPRQLADDGVGHHDAEGREDDRPGPVAALALEGPPRADDGEHRGGDADGDAAGATGGRLCEKREIHQVLLLAM